MIVISSYCIIDGQERRMTSKGRWTRNYRQARYFNTREEAQAAMPAGSRIMGCCYSAAEIAALNAM